MNIVDPNDESSKAGIDLEDTSKNRAQAYVRVVNCI